MTVKFKFRKPEFGDSLSDISRTLLELGSITEQLSAEERFLVDHPSGRAENDAEHAHMLSRLAPIIAMRYFPELDAGLTSLYATIHDDIEAYVGDTPERIFAPARIHTANKVIRSSKKARSSVCEDAR